MDLTGKKILFIIAPKNFRDEELTDPRRVLEGYKAKTLVASNTLSTCTGMLGAKVTPNLTLDKVQVYDYDAVVFVGGSGSTVYYEDKTALSIARESNLKGRLTCSICLASGTLAGAGVFKGKDATGWPDTKILVERNGGMYTGNDVEVSGRVITAKGPSAAKQFGEAIAKALANKRED